MSKLRIFVSSVQKELENERQTVLALVSTDTFLQYHCEVILYELEPASPEKALKGCLKALRTCDIYIGIIWKEYGTEVDGISITQHEYREAKKLELPVLIFIKGQSNLTREVGTGSLLDEIRKDDYKYKRFEHVVQLREEVRNSLVKLLKEKYSVEPSSDENEIAEQTIKATSDFESAPLKRLRWEDLDYNVARSLVARAEGRKEAGLKKPDVLRSLFVRGLVWKDHEADIDYATAAGTVLLAKDPSVVFPHCRVFADAYAGLKPDHKPLDHEDIRGPLPDVIEKVIAFIDRNTRHPIRVVGLNRIRVDEYPVAAIREAVVNACAHRDYEDKGRKIIVEKFSDRIVISSPGFPPPPITLKKLRADDYRPCSRNPILAQYLSFFHRIEERGSGFRRMKHAMLDHGLDPPRFGTQSSYFQAVFQGPGDDMDRLRVRDEAQWKVVSPSVEQQLNVRQKKVVEQVLREGSVTSGWVRRQLKVAYDTANRDLLGLVRLGILVREGKGRSTRFLLVEKGRGR